MKLTSKINILDFKLLAVCLAVFAQQWANGTLATRKVDYTGHVVLRLSPKSPGDFRLIFNLSARDYLDLEIWGEPMVNRTLDIRVAPHAYNYITKCLTYYNIKWKVEILDIQSLIDEQRHPRRTRTRSKRSTTKFKYMKRRRYKGKKYWSKLKKRARRRNMAKLRRRRAFHTGKDTIVGQYARYRMVRMWMKSLETLYPDLAKVIEIGRTYENRALEIVKIGSNKENVNKSAIWLDGGIHSREWIAPATVIYIADKLLKDYGKDEKTTALVNNFDWYLLPVANPDGYEYSHTVDRLWRKTRSRPPVVGYSRCLGVDMNRNFGFQWKGHCNQNWLFLCGSSNPCQNTYAGEVPFSEPEVQAMAHTIYRHRENIKLYLSLHSYSQLWLTPWGYTDHPPKDKLDLMNIAKKGIDALRKTHGTRYVAGSPAQILYAAGGGSYDWAKAVAGIKYSYTLELRDKGSAQCLTRPKMPQDIEFVKNKFMDTTTRYGFLLPQQYILPVGEETWNGIKVVASELNNILDILE